MKTIFLKGLCGLSLVMIPEAVFASSANNLKSVSPHQYTHLIETYQSQTFEPLSQTALFPEQSASVSNYPKLAKVYFITNNKEQVFSPVDGNTFDDPTGEACARYGFKVTSCASGLFNKACPYNDKIYDKCCDASYKYTASQCSYPKKLSSDTCGGKYKCLCDTSYYSYTYCDSPKVKGSSCTDDNGTYYASCSCPIGVSAPNGCETYYTSPCSFVCKKAKADNCSNRTGVQTPYGCEKYFSDCPSKCEKAYTDNCRNRIAVSAPNGCESYYADCQSKCEVAKTASTDNCANRTAVSTTNGCEKYYSDCPSICEKAYEPIILYGDGTISKEYPLLASKTPIGIVFDEDNRLAMGLFYIKEDGSEGLSTMKWSNNQYDIPDLENCVVPAGYSTTILSSCAVDGRANTDKILACGSECGGTPTATACNLYEPSGCTKNFCKKGKWFLPSMRDLDNIFKVINMISSQRGGSPLTYIWNVSNSSNMIWSSNETSHSKAWTIRLYNIGPKKEATKDNEDLISVRPVVKY